MAQIVKRLPTMWETRVQSLDQEDLLEKDMATHSIILAWKIPWMEEPGRLQCMGSQRVGHDWATSLHFKHLIGEENNYIHLWRNSHSLWLDLPLLGNTGTHLCQHTVVLSLRVAVWLAIEKIYILLISLCSPILIASLGTFSSFGIHNIVFGLVMVK